MDRLDALYDAAIAGDVDAIAKLEMEADKLDDDHETILHIESRNGNTERVRFLLKKFANKNLLAKLTISRRTALHLSIYGGHTEVAAVIIEEARRQFPETSFQAFLRQGDKDMDTALHAAVSGGNITIVKLLVQADPNDKHVQNNEGKTPIYIASEKGYKDIVKEICTTCTDLSLDGPGGRTTALHALIQNIGQEGAVDVIWMIIYAAKHWTSVDFEALFSTTDESGSTVLQVAVERNDVDAVRLILQEDPAYQHGREIKRNGLMRLIFKAIDYGSSDDIIKLLSQTYQVGISPELKDVVPLILAMKTRDEDSVLSLLKGAKDLVTFTEDNGWTALHYAVYHQFDSVLGAIIAALEDINKDDISCIRGFVYGNMVPTPFHVAVECGYVSTLVRLMQLWPALPSASEADNSPYTAINKDGRNILHLAAANSNKEMIEGILKYCPEEYKNIILKQQDINGDTPLHLLISQGCYIPQLIKHKGINTMVRNNNNLTAWDMLYVKNDIVADQVQIKIAFDDIQINKSGWNLWAKNKEKKGDIWSSVPANKRRMKDVIFDEDKRLLIDRSREKMKTLVEKYRKRNNAQIVVAALITTLTFTVGFTMPGGLHQSGEVDEGSVILSKKTAFNAFMVSDALALLLSTTSLFFYFLQSLIEDIGQVSTIDHASIVLNIVSIMAMMLTFISGTYLVLSHSPALAITVCIIGSLFFFLLIVLLIKIVYDRLAVKINLE